MEQLIQLIQITESGTANVIAEVTLNTPFDKMKNRELLRRHLNKIMSLLYGYELKVYYRIQEKENEQSNPGK